jgi:TonB-dependent Receptor Plug Domain
MMFCRTLTLLVVASAMVAGCSSSTRKASPVASRNVITADEIARVNAGNAYEAIQRLQPRMLAKQRGPSSINLESQSRILVYVDGTRFGGIESLSLIPATSILKIQFLSASEATFRYGTGNSAGAIEITSRTSQRDSP